MGRATSVIENPSRLVRSGGRHPDPDLGPTPGPDHLSVGGLSHDLPADLTAVREARCLVRDALDGWDLTDVSGDVELVASELVANALCHGLELGRPTAPASSAPASGEAVSRRVASVRISLIRTAGHLVCAVTDPSRRPPVRRSAQAMAGSGRGLELVESLSLCWGWTMLGEPVGRAEARRGRRAGKSVWAVFSVSGLHGSVRVGAA